MSKNRGADRARDEADGIDAEGLQRSDPRVRMREKQLGEHQAGDGAIQEEIVPLDRGPDSGRDNGAAKLDLMLGWGEASEVAVEGCHAQFLLRKPFTGREQGPFAQERAGLSRGSRCASDGR